MDANRAAFAELMRKSHEYVEQNVPAEDRASLLSNIAVFECGVTHEDDDISSHAFDKYCCLIRGHAEAAPYVEVARMWRRSLGLHSLLDSMDRFEQLRAAEAAAEAAKSE